MTWLIYDMGFVLACLGALGRDGTLHSLIFFLKFCIVWTNTSVLTYKLYVIFQWYFSICFNVTFSWAASSEFVSSSIPSWQILTAHAQPFRGARDLAFCLKVSLDSLLVWASSDGSGETARMRRLAWTFAARIGDKYQIRLARPSLCINVHKHFGIRPHPIGGGPGVLVYNPKMLCLSK